MAKNEKEFSIRIQPKIYFDLKELHGDEAINILIEMFTTELKRHFEPTEKRVQAVKDLVCDSVSQAEKFDKEMSINNET